MVDPTPTPHPGERRDPSAAPAILDVAAMSLEQLREEVEYWRQNCSAWISISATHVNWIARETGAERRRAKAAMQRLRSPTRLHDEFRHVLAHALTGDIHDACVACGGPVKPGALVIATAEDGDMHVECFTDDPAHYVLHARIPVSPELLAIDDEEEGAARIIDPNLTVLEHDPGYTLARMAEISGVTPTGKAAADA